MADSLFDKKLAKQFDTISKDKAKVHDNEIRAVNDFMKKVSRQTICSVLDIVDKYGHPNEQRLSKELREKYISGKGLEFDDIKTLESLYKSNCRVMNNKDSQDERE